VNTNQELYELSKGFDIALDVVLRLAPTVSSKAKKLFGSANTGQNNWGGGAVPLSNGLDTRPCKILNQRLFWNGSAAGVEC